MRVRVNFTLDFNPEEYRDTMEVDMANEEIRDTIQQRAISDALYGLIDEGVPARVIRR